MIEVKNVSKAYRDRKAVEHVSMTIKEKQIFGLIGTNGAGKSTTLRMIAGIIHPDEGEVLIDKESVYQNARAKSSLFYIADEPYFFSGATALSMAKHYESVYTGFDFGCFCAYLDRFGLEKKRRINTYSKGMKKQLITLLGICSNTKYLLCDETFDGLDPVMRQRIKTILTKQCKERGLTTIIASHNLRELEDICDHVGLLHKGDVLFAKKLTDMKCNIQKVQCVFKTETDAVIGMQNAEIIKKEKRGSLYTLTIRGRKEEVIANFSKVSTVFFEILPLTLEEIFISETEVAGYDIGEFLMDEDS